MVKVTHLNYRWPKPWLAIAQESLPMPIDTKRNIPDWRLVASNTALAQDALSGGYLYLFDLIVMHLFSSLQKDSPRVALFTTVAFVMVAVGRSIILKQMKLGLRKPWTLTKLFFLVSTLGTATMAFRSTIVFELYGMTNITGYICFLGLTTFATGMITSFRSNKYLLFSQIVTLLIPGSISLLISSDQPSKIFAIILILFTLYILYQGNLTYKNWIDLERTKTYLEAERNQLKTFVDEIPGSAAWLSADMKIYGANQTFQEILASHNESIPQEIESKTSLFLSSKDEALATQITVNIKNIRRTFSLHLKRYSYKNETCIFLIMMDIQDQIILAQNLEDQRAKNVQASRLSSLGEMAGGIAHEINNPLAIIHGRTKQIENILQRNLESATKNDLSSIQMELTEKTKSIINTVDRINKIIKGLKAFSRDGSVDSMEIASAKVIIEDTLVFCSEKFRNHGVEIDVKSAEQELFISCQPQQISQVLLNLLNNAFDAQVSNDVKKISVEVLSSDDFIKFRVSDYGEGVKFPDKLFQAFFTTKPLGQGTGIGLSISYGIVKRHQGNMYLESPQNPTTICFEIPATKKAA